MIGVSVAALLTSSLLEPLKQDTVLITPIDTALPSSTQLIPLANLRTHEKSNHHVASLLEHYVLSTFLGQLTRRLSLYILWNHHFVAAMTGQSRS